MRTVFGSGEAPVGGARSPSRSTGRIRVRRHVGVARRSNHAGGGAGQRVRERVSSERLFGEPRTASTRSVSTSTPTGCSASSRTRRGESSVGVDRWDGGTVAPLATACGPRAFVRLHSVPVRPAPSGKARPACPGANYADARVLATHRRAGRTAPLPCRRGADLRELVYRPRRQFANFRVRIGVGYGAELDERHRRIELPECPARVSTDDR